MIGAGLTGHLVRPGSSGLQSLQPSRGSVVSRSGLAMLAARPPSRNCKANSTPSAARAAPGCSPRRSAPGIRSASSWRRPLTLAHDIKQAAPDQPVILTVHEMKRLARKAAELMTLSAQLQAGGIGLDLLTGPQTGIYDPNGMGSMLFAVCAVAAQLDRNYIREKTLEGQQVAASKGNHGGRPKVIDEDMVLFARALRDRGTPIGEITQKLTIKTGKNAGQHPSVASLYRALAEPPR